MRSFFLFISSLIFVNTLSAQVFYGENKFIEYHRGTLPIVISVPHGGLVDPDSIPDRTCNNPTTVTDSKTIELALQIDSSFYKLTGCHIHLIICNLKRTKLDCNRNLGDGACSDVYAIKAWTEFHNFIDSAQKYALAENNNKAFYIDLHGHGKSNQRLELGYLLSDNAYELSDSILNTSTYINKSSLKHLVSSNVNAHKHSELLRGQIALGTLLGNAGFPAVPSAQIPKPDTTTNYFDGGYNTENYTSKVPGNIVNGLQIECNNIGVRDTYLNRKKFADSLAIVLTNYLAYHLNLSFNSCNVSGLNDSEFKKIQFFPNPSNSEINIRGNFMEGSYLKIFDLSGKLQMIVLIEQEEIQKLDISKLKAGVYILQYFDQNSIINTKLIKN